MDTAALGTAIRLARKQKHMTGEKLSGLCEIGPVFLRKIESGAKAPSLATFIRLCNALETSPQTLLKGNLVPNDIDAQLAVVEKLAGLSKSQSELALSMIDTMADHME